MSSKDYKVEIELPWRKVKVKVRPLSLRDETRLVANAGNMREAYLDMIKEVCEPMEGFKLEDITLADLDYLITQIRLITYGNELILSGIKCPHCGFKNSNVKFDITTIPHHPNDYINLMRLEKSDIGFESIKVAAPSLKRLNEITEMVKPEPNESEESLLTRHLMLLQLSVFIDYDMKELIDMADDGRLALYDIKKANNLLKLNPIGLDKVIEVICHHRDCKKTFDFTLDILSVGLMSPFNDLSN